MVSTATGAVASAVAWAVAGAAGSSLALGFLAQRQPLCMGGPLASWPAARRPAQLFHQAAVSSSVGNHAATWPAEGQTDTVSLPLKI